MDTKLGRKEHRRKLRWVGVTGEALVAVCAGVVTNSLFHLAYFAVFGESLAFRVERAYLAWEIYLAPFQSVNGFTFAVGEVVLALVSLGAIAPAAVGMALWWMFGRPAFHRLVRVGLLGLGRSGKQRVSQKRSRA